MVSTPYSLTDNWTDANRYTAASDSEMLLSNPSAQDLRWARAADETAPGVAPSRAHLLRPGRSQSIPLTMGETLWMAGAPGGHAVIDIFAPLPGTVITGEPALQSRGELVTLVSDGNGPDAGAEIMAGGQTYLAAAGATAIADLPGLVPSREVTLEHFGAVGDGVTDDTAAWDAANDYLESLGGGVIQGALGKTYALLDTTIASNVTFRGHGPRRGGLCAHANIAQGQGWLTNRDLNTDDETRTCYNVAILDCDLDGSNMPFDRWLTQADGTPITDPEADYVMGTGALASGISGVDLTAVVTDGAVTSVTVNNGGTGWNSHPTHPYQPSTVAIRFEGGGGAGAVATATISGGTIVSVDVDKGGIGYTSAPSATTMGGYADISLLVDPSVDRRNPNYDILGFGVTLRKVVAPRVENVRFLNFKSGGLSDAGCLNGAYRDLTFEGCGKNDGPYHCVWVQSYTSPTADPISAAFADSENTLLEDIYIDGAGRSAVAWGPTKGGTIRRLTARNTGESTLWVSDVLHQNGGRSVFDQLDLRDNILTDIAAAHIEAGNNSNILIKNSRFEGGCELAIELAGCRNIKVIDCEFIDNGTALSQLPGRTPFGPFSERYAYNVGNYPVAGSELIRQEMDVIKVGTVSGVGSDQVVIRNCLFSESRSAYPPQLLNRIKFGGGNFLAGSLVFEGNDLTGLPDDMVLMYGQGNVFDANIPVTIRDNLGHASEGPVVLTQTVGNTNTKFLRPGFRPSRIEAVALSVSGAGSDGQLNWVSSGAHVAFCTARPTEASPMSVDGALVETRSADGSTVTCRIELKDWEVDGVNLTVTTNTENVDVRFVCYP